MPPPRPARGSLAAPQRSAKAAKMAASGLHARAMNDRTAAPSMRCRVAHCLRLRQLLCCSALLLASACTSLPRTVQREPSKAPPPAADTVLGRIVKASTPDPELTGFRLMPGGEYALHARLELVRRAQRTLDVQYYMIIGDQTGRYMLRTLRDASLRGVRVRLLVDDLHTAGDAILLGLDAYPNVEVRLFNPFPSGRGSLVVRYTVNAGEFERVNRRMHNKLFIADGVMAVAGGRNIADRFFMGSTVANYVDLDTLVAGAILPRLSSQFDEYWNSPNIFPIGSIVKSNETPEALQKNFERLTARATMSEYQPVEQPNEAWAPAGGQASPSPMPLKEPEPPPPNDMLGYNPVAEDLDAGRIGLIWADAQAYADSPDKAIGRVSTYGAVPIDDVDSVRYNVIEMIRRARKEVVIATPFLIPGKSGIETIRASTERGVKFTIVTNSLAAAPEPAVHTAYRRYRPEMLGLGVDLFETSPIRVSRSLRLGRFSTSVGKLHAKCAVIDRQTVFIGSMNFDPRSEQHNTELGLFIHSPTLAQQVLKLVDVIKQQGSYQVRLAPNGQDVQWEVLGSNGQAPLVEEPETNMWSRFMIDVLSLIAPEDLL
jgi:cardiolipin synthase C